MNIEFVKLNEQILREWCECTLTWDVSYDDEPEGMITCEGPYGACNYFDSLGEQEEWLSDNGYYNAEEVIERRDEVLKFLNQLDNA
jgi:hypothetical protein